MKLTGAILALGAALLLAAPAAARTPQICARYARQIAHYQAMLEEAEKRDSALWEERLEAQVQMLRERAEAECPDLFHDDSTAEAFAALMKVAARAALSYFTFGAF